MKKLFVLTLGLLVAGQFFAQKTSENNETIQHLAYPKTLVPGAESVSVSYNHNIPAGDPWEKDNPLDLTSKTVAALLTPHGYTFRTTEADLTITLNAGPFISSVVAEDASLYSEKAWFQPKYIIEVNWILKLEGAVNKEIALNTYKNNIEVSSPLINSAGYTLKIEDKEKVDEIIESERAKLDIVAAKEYMKVMMDLVRLVIDDQLSYKKTAEEITLISVKTNKQFDGAEWDQYYSKAVEMLSELSKGTKPEALYVKNMDVFEFWEQQLQALKSDPKENKRLLEAASQNLFSTLLVINPEAIKDEYIEILVQDSPSELKKFTRERDSAKAKQASRQDCTRDYAELFKAPPLAKNNYQVSYTDTKGAQNQGVLVISKPYGISEVDPCVGFSLYDLSDYTIAHGKVTAREAIDHKNIESYEIFADRYVKVTYSDPTVASLKGPESFMWEVLTGDINLYVLSSTFVIDKGKKAQVVFNYSRIAELMDDKPEIAEKIRNGHYGNEPIKAKTSRLARFAQQGTVSEISPEIIMKMVYDYNIN